MGNKSFNPLFFNKKKCLKPLSGVVLRTLNYVFEDVLPSRYIGSLDETKN